MAVDADLMSPCFGFSLDQLMELAGLSVASAVFAEYPPGDAGKNRTRVLIIAGPGNNGGDGLVAGRHLWNFGYGVEICYPKRTDKPLYHGLVQQCTSLGVRFVDAHELAAPLSATYDVVVDALFGFSFRGSPRAPFDALLELLLPAARPPALVSVDIPSGWHVERGDESGGGLRPDVLVSLTAPKLAARFFEARLSRAATRPVRLVNEQGAHYIGGRFVPPEIRSKYNLKLPPYEGTSMCVKLNPATQSAADMRATYAKGELLESNVSKDPMEQFETWFSEAASHPAVKEANAMSFASVSSEGQPSVRMVLLKGFDDRGFVVFTNYDSRKGVELLGNAQAAMTMWWEPLQRCVRVEGAIEKVSEAESEEYFSSRPRDSQLGAWVSDQSSVIPSRQVLEDKVRELEEMYAGRDIIPKPPHWGGFRLVPRSIEFWQGRPSRLHDRLVYVRDDVSSRVWTMRRLSP